MILPWWAIRKTNRCNRVAVRTIKIIIHETVSGFLKSQSSKNHRLKKNVGKSKNNIITMCKYERNLVSKQIKTPFNFVAFVWTRRVDDTHLTPTLKADDLQHSIRPMTSVSSDRSRVSAALASMYFTKLTFRVKWVKKLFLLFNLPTCNKFDTKKNQFFICVMSLWLKTLILLLKVVDIV